MSEPQMLNKLIGLAISHDMEFSITKDKDHEMVGVYSTEFYKISVGKFSYYADSFNESTLIEAYAHLTGQLRVDFALRERGINIDSNS